MQKILRISAISGALALVVGCQPSSPSSPSAPQPAQTSTTLEIDLRSPDQAVKTWWRLSDMREAHAVSECLAQLRDSAKGPLKFVAQIATGDTLRALNPSAPAHHCLHETYSREIQEVKTESETRAVVSAVIKNVTDIPPRALPSSVGIEWRERGHPVKYILEKTSDGRWKVSQVLKLNYKKDYEQAYEVQDRPPYPSYMGHP